MTWGEIKEYIDKHPNIHGDIAYVYDFANGSEYEAGIDEFKVNDKEWFPSITINESSLEE